MYTPLIVNLSIKTHAISITYVNKLREVTNNSERSKVKVSARWEVVVYIMSNSCLYKPGQSCDKTRARESSEVGKTLVDGCGSYGGRKGGRETERERDRTKEKEKAYT